MAMNSAGALSIGSWPVVRVTTLEPGSQAPPQKPGSRTRWRMASMVGSLGSVQSMKVRGTLATRAASKSSGCS